MEKIICKKIALSAISLLVSALSLAQTSDVDSTQHSKLAETQQLSEVVVKSSLPKTRVKGDAMRTIVNGTILETAGSCTDVLNRIPQLKAKMVERWRCSVVATQRSISIAERCRI